MNRKLDIEDMLKRFRKEPDPRVKRAVLARYAERFDREQRATARAERLWRRPVPLYMAAALAIVVAGISFIAGQKHSRPAHTARSESTAVQDSLANAVINQSWHFAPRDVL
jgi:hypothetical protein